MNVNPPDVIKVALPRVTTAWVCGIVAAIVPTPILTEMMTEPINTANTAGLSFLLVCRLLVYYPSILACIVIRVKAIVSTRQIVSKPAWRTP